MDVLRMNRFCNLVPFDCLRHYCRSLLQTSVWFMKTDRSCYDVSWHARGVPQSARNVPAIPQHARYATGAAAPEAS